jgi:hypothetical protein
MPEMNREEVVQAFEKLAKPFVGAGSLDPRTMLEQFIQFYRDVRISGASLDEDGDMLLLEWGTAQPHLLDRFTDLRTRNPNRLKFDRTTYQWLGLTRQVFASGGDEEAEFDDGAITLSLFLFFERATADQEASNLWIHGPNNISAALKKFTAAGYVKRLLSSRTSRVNAFVSAIG